LKLVLFFGLKGALQTENSSKTKTGFAGISLVEHFHASASRPPLTNTGGSRATSLLHRFLDEGFLHRFGQELRQVAAEHRDLPQERTAHV